MNLSHGALQWSRLCYRKLCRVAFATPHLEIRELIEGGVKVESTNQSPNTPTYLNPEHRTRRLSGMEITLELVIRRFGSFDG